MFVCLCLFCRAFSPRFLGYQSVHYLEGQPLGHLIINVQLSNEACSEWSGLDLNIVLSVTLLS